MTRGEILAAFPNPIRVLDHGYVRVVGMVACY